jgi:hypothetical protein
LLVTTWTVIEFEPIAVTLPANTDVRGVHCCEALPVSASAVAAATHATSAAAMKMSNLRIVSSKGKIVGGITSMPDTQSPGSVTILYPQD